MSYLDGVPNDVLKRIRKYLVSKDHVEITLAFLPENTNNHTIIYKEYCIDVKLHFEHKEEKLYMEAVKLVLIYPRRGIKWYHVVALTPARGIRVYTKMEHDIFIPKETPGFINVEKTILKTIITDMIQPCTNTQCFCQQFPEKYPIEYNQLLEMLKKYS